MAGARHEPGLDLGEPLHAADALNCMGLVSGTLENAAPDDTAILRLHAEQVRVSRQVKRVGVVRATAVTEERDHEVAEELASERVEVVHVPIGRQVESCPPIRVEGDTTILSIVEEIVVVERRLLLKEEVHMTKVRTTRAHLQTVRLREQHAVITRDPGDERQ